MRTTPPTGFNIAQFYQNIYTFQQWDVFPGHTTLGPKNVVKHMEVLQLPERMDGLRVLDIAPWNGFFSFECVRRGASEVVSVGPEDPKDTGFSKTLDLLEIDNCKYVRDSVYNLTPEKVGQFDIVLFLGLIYHLRHPLLALDRVFDVCKNRMFTDSPIIDRIVFDKTVSEEMRLEILGAGRVLHELPITYFTKGAETGDPYNWFMPNIKCFQAFVESAGFKIDSTHDDGGGWYSIAATKGERNFTPDVEGYNPFAARI